MEDSLCYGNPVNVATSSSPIQEEDYQLNLVINFVSDEVIVGEINQQNMEIHDEARCVDALLEFIDQNSKGSNRTKDLSLSMVFSKTMEGEWYTVSKKKKNVPPVPTKGQLLGLLNRFLNEDFFFLELPRSG